jgi:hypothetical protein
VFGLLGYRENDLTAALAFTLARSEQLLSKLSQRVLPGLDLGNVEIRLETRDEQGRTDFEIDTGSALVVVEAKRGWLLPGETQLVLYAGRVQQRTTGALVSLSSASADWAAQVLPTQVQGVPLRHLSWTAVHEDLAAVRSGVHGVQRFWLDELHRYLGRAIKLRDPADSWTYCVVLNTARPGDGGARSFRDFVTQDDSYFHPFGWGHGWPKTPPNFLAFRWSGHVQSVRRVLASEIVQSLQDRWDDIPADGSTNRPHVVYKLGPELPGMPIPSGKHYRAARVWVLLDQLLISPTLAAAMDGTKQVSASSLVDGVQAV